MLRINRRDRSAVAEATKSVSTSETLNFVSLESRLKPDSEIISILENLAKSTKSASTSETLNLASASTSETLNLAPLKSLLKPDSDIISILEDLGIATKSASTSETLIDQTRLNAVYDIFSGTLGDTRSTVYKGMKGAVVGRLRYTVDGHLIDCTRQGPTGLIIPRDVSSVRDMSTDALFILLVEDRDDFMRLATERFYNRFPCIIVKTEGKPDLPTRLFLKKMKMQLKLPILAVFNCYPCSLKMLSVHKPTNMFDAADLTTLGIKWVGLRPSDLDKYQLPQYCREPMTEKDIKICKDLLEEDFVKKNPGWVEELNIMLKLKQKANILSLGSLGILFLCKVFLPMKFQEQDWL